MAQASGPFAVSAQLDPPSDLLEIITSPQDVVFHCAADVLCAHTRLLTRHGNAWISGVLRHDAIPVPPLSPGSAATSPSLATASDVGLWRSPEPLHVKIHEEDWAGFHVLLRCHYGVVTLTDVAVFLSFCRFIDKIAHQPAQQMLKRQTAAAALPLPVAVVHELGLLMRQKPNEAAFFLAEEVQASVARDWRVYVEELPPCLWGWFRFPYNVQEMERIQTMDNWYRAHREAPAQLEAFDAAARSVCLELLRAAELVDLRRLSLFACLDRTRFDAALDLAVLTAEGHAETVAWEIPDIVAALGGNGRATSPSHVLRNGSVVHIALNAAKAGAYLHVEQCAPLRYLPLEYIAMVNGTSRQGRAAFSEEHSNYGFGELLPSTGAISVRFVLRFVPLSSIRDFAR